MRICIDATPLLLRSAGVKTYFYHWLRHLWKAAEGQADLKFSAFPRLREAGALDHEQSHLGRWATLWRLGLLWSANKGAPLAQRLLLPPCDVLHLSNQLRRPPARVPLTATVYDMTAFLMPQFHTEGNVRAERNFADRALRPARGLIAISEHTRSDAAKVLGLDPSRIDVIYPGVADEYFRAHMASRPKPYVLSLGTIEPRKNIDRLLDAWELLPRSAREEFELVVAGPAGWRAESTLARLQSGTAGVRYLGYVAETQMPGLVAGATALAYPSYYEGFGLPVAQAMAAGVAVVTSNASCLPEVVAEGGLTVDPNSAGELAAALDRVLTSPALRQQLGTAGAARARQLYRWEVCAQRSLEFFRKVAAKL